MSYAYGITVQVLTAIPVIDPYSGEATGEDWTTPTSVPWVGVAVEPRVSVETVTDGRAPVVIGRTLYGDPTVTITARNRVSLPDGSIWQVDGDPADWVNPWTGWHPGQVVQLKKADG